MFLGVSLNFVVGAFLETSECERESLLGRNTGWMFYAKRFVILI